MEQRLQWRSRLLPGDSPGVAQGGFDRQRRQSAGRGLPRAPGAGASALRQLWAPGGSAGLGTSSALPLAPSGLAARLSSITENAACATAGPLGRALQVQAGISTMPWAALRWGSMVRQKLSWAFKGIVVEGRCLLAHTRSPIPLTQTSEKTVTHIFLRDPVWVSVFPELALIVLQHMALRLGMKVPDVEADLNDGCSKVEKLVALRCARNPRCSPFITGTKPSAYFMRPVPTFVNLAQQRKLRTPENCVRAKSKERREAWTQNSLPQTLDHMPMWRTLDNFDSLPDFHMRTMESMPTWRPADMPERRLIEENTVRTMDSLASYGDLAGLTTLQTLDELPAFVTADYGFLRTAESLPEMVQNVGPRRGDGIRQWPSPHWSPGSNQVWPA